jgi:hypothetical protein
MRLDARRGPHVNQAAGANHRRNRRSASQPDQTPPIVNDGLGKINTQVAQAGPPRDHCDPFAWTITIPDWRQPRLRKDLDCFRQHSLWLWLRLRADDA